MARPARSSRFVLLGLGALLLGLALAACDDPAVLTADMPLHLEDHLDVAVLEGSELPANPAMPVEWHFDEPQPDWEATPLWNPPFGEPMLEPTSDALRVTLTEETRVPGGLLRGVIRVEVPDWSRSEWSEVLVRARADSASSVNVLGLGFNLREGRGTEAEPRPRFPFQTGSASPVVRDGTIHTYRLPVATGQAFQGPWRQLLLVFGSEGEPGSIEVFSVSVVPTGAVFAEMRHGVRPVPIGQEIRRTLYTHAPGTIAYRLRVPQGGRLDAGLGVVSGRVPVTFRIQVQPGSSATETVFEETYSEPALWAQRSVDLSSFAGQSVTVSLETASDVPGTVALWGAPTVSGDRSTDKPNVVFYVIDGGGADYMSLYGYNRRTTPNLERLAAEGALFEHAYSNSSWTKPSTASFMTSLHNSVLGNTRDLPVEPLSPQAITMAERFHAAGYQTAVFTANPNAGTVSGLERGADLLRESGFPNADEASSVDLHNAFWRWRDANPGHPYWVHFQTTDVHAVSNNRLMRVGGLTDGPFAGMFVSPADLSTLRDWQGRLQAAGGGHMRSEAFERTGIDRIATYTLYQGLYDQQMAHNDYQLGRLIDRLKASGEWQNTLLIVAADHSVQAALADMPLALLEAVPPAVIAPLFANYVSRVPLLFVWPGHISGGRRIDAAVSMIDVLPTLLDLAGLPMPEVMQGQSLAPLLRGEPGWTPRPVILDEFAIDLATGELHGRLDVVDGQWGASMWIGPPRGDPGSRRPWPVRVFDVLADPWALEPINDQRPELVDKYTGFLEEQWAAHQALATRFTQGGETALTPEQLERLRTLGYIR